MGLVWGNLADQDWIRFLIDLIDRIPTTVVWITIDKDVLRPEEATTNWHQGEMPLDALLEAVRLLCAGRHVLGIDICGEYSRPRYDKRLRRLAARVFQPHPERDRDFARNAQTNAQLVEILAGCPLTRTAP